MRCSEYNNGWCESGGRKCDGCVEVPPKPNDNNDNYHGPMRKEYQ